LLTRKQLRPLHEGLFAWNLASVLFSFVFLKHAKVFSISFGPNNEYAFFYRFFRGGIRINNFFTSIRRTTLLAHCPIPAVV
jgi:hypothetical protein